MSIYRKSDSDRRPQSDVHADVTVQRGPVAQRTTSPKDVEPGEGKHLRRAEPASMVIPPTWKWVDSLPPNVRPSALLRQYPRIANLIAATWGDRASFETYMESLLTDKRGNRRGFPPEVLKDLAALRRFHDIAKEDTSVWHTVHKRG